MNLFYHPGFASSPAADPAKSSTTREVREVPGKIHIVRVLEQSIGIVPPVHLIVTEPTGTAIIIKSTDGAVKLHDAPLGVMTDSPSYDRHMTSLRNDVNLSAAATPTKKTEDMNFAPLSGAEIARSGDA